MNNSNFGRIVKLSTVSNIAEFAHSFLI